MTHTFHENIYLKYHIYNSLFLTLPFDEIYQTGTLLPLLAVECKKRLAKGDNPREIVSDFLAERTSGDVTEQLDILFSMVKYAERQVVLFDAVEDAGFGSVHDLYGPGTMANLLNNVRSQNKLELFKDKLERFSLRLVLTAHPTQFYPSRVLSIISDLDDAIKANDVRRINLILLQLGKTPFLQKKKPTPLVEAIRLIWFLDYVFYGAVTGIIHELDKGVLAGEDLDLSNLVRIGFWPGGDRDGNPFVTTETTWQVAEILHFRIVSNYYRSLGELKRRLTFRNVYERIETIRQKIGEQRANRSAGYDSAEELLADLGVVREELNRQHMYEFRDMLDEFMTGVRLFGFYFATIDIRQDSQKHDELISGVASWAGWPDRDGLQNLDAAERVKLLRAKQVELHSGTYDGEGMKDIIESIECVARIQSEFGEKACNRYIISHTENVYHLMSVFFLFKWTIGKVPVDIVPLFETIEDLANAPQIMTELYGDELYRQHLKQRGDRQTIMLGFSDGTKDGGYLRANWSIFKAKEALTQVSRQAGIEAVFFDGRGGPPARGGGKSNKFYSSLGSGIEDAEVQLTVQGQTISSNFGTVESARYNIEQLLTSGIENEVLRNQSRELDPEDKLIIDKLAEASYAAYTELKNDPDFLPYLEDMGTLKYYAMTNIGSRPVKRGGNEPITLEKLRAIPFVGSWNQMKQNVPGFYGMGTAIRKYSEGGSIDDLKELYKRSLFFKALMDNSMMSMCKSFFPLTEHLKDHPRFGRIWSKIFDEFTLTKDFLLDISGQQELLETTPNSRDSILMREELILPTLVIQQYALMRIRELESSGQEYAAKVYHTLAMRTMFGIINAGRNSA